MNLDCMIVGQGLAGTLLVHELISQGKSVVVFDDPEQPKASEVAAGLINPVVFKRMNKSWLLDELFSQMEITYRRLEILLNETIYFPSPLYRILDEKEFLSWKEKGINNQLENYLEIEPDLIFKPDNLRIPHGIGLVKKAGRLELKILISSFSNYLEKKHLLRKEKFDYERLHVNSESVIYNEFEAKKIIFCEGPAAAQNPYFSELKFKSSKGEIILANIPGLNLNEIVSRDLFILPLGSNQFKIGANYSWDELDWQITKSAKEELSEKLKNLIDVPFEIQDQLAGIRPTMHDRKPVLGFLPHSPHVGIFNGLGSKGVLMGPYFARQFARFICGISDEIHSEVNIQRYFRKK